MSHRRKKGNPEDPKPLNFEHADAKGISDHLKEPFLTPEDERGDSENDQYYEVEEAVSPEEAQERKTEDSL